MASYVLVGDSQSKKNFLSSFIEKENIKSYNLFDYQETLKIPQVREIKKLLSTKAFSGAKRLFVIRDATPEAQNALLKTLEELPEDTSFIFLDETMVIPTIHSRTQILNFKIRKVDVDANLSSILENFLNSNKDLSSTFLFSEELFMQSPDLNFANLIFCLREILFKQIQEDGFEKTGLTLRLLKSLYRYLPFVENNNLNKKLLFERIIIKEISL